MHNYEDIFTAKTIPDIEVQVVSEKGAAYLILEGMTVDVVLPVSHAVGQSVVSLL